MPVEAYRRQLYGAFALNVQSLRGSGNVNALMSASAQSPLFTAKQGQYLAFIFIYKRLLGQAPAEADIQRHFKVSPPAVHQMILTLEHRGLIRRRPGVARSIELLVPGEALPILEWALRQERLPED
jgi:repressor LexA